MEDDPSENITSGSGQQLAPRRPPKRLSNHDDGICKDEPLFASSSRNGASVDEDDSFGILDDSPDKKIQCFVCAKDITHLNSTRRQIHTNGCLDQQQSIDSHGKAKEKHANTHDCPICGDPLGPGPHRAVHLKRCGKEHNISGKGLVDMVNVQTKIAEVKKKQNKPHTKAPSPTYKKIQPAKLKNQPQTVSDENLQIALAMSVSMESVLPDSLKEASPQFTRIPDPSENRRKRPRSYAIVEFAPRSCKCQVFATIHSRFLEVFRTAKGPSVKDVNNMSSKKAFLYSSAQRRLVTKMNRLNKLSREFANLLSDKQFSDMNISCDDGVIAVHRCVLHVRTTLPVSDACFRLGHRAEAVQAWLRFVYSGDVDWGLEHVDIIADLAEKYGPEDLPGVIKQLAGSEEMEYADMVESGITCAHCASTASCKSSSEEQVSGKTDSNDCSTNKSLCDNKENSPWKPCSPNAHATQLNSNQSVAGTITLSTDTRTDGTSCNIWDCEDPLQGINFSSTSQTLDDPGNSPLVNDRRSHDNKAMNLFDVLSRPCTSDENLKHEHIDSVVQANEAEVVAEEAITFDDGGFVEGPSRELSFCSAEEFPYVEDNIEVVPDSPVAAHNDRIEDNESIIVLSDSPEPPPRLPSTSFVLSSHEREPSPVTDFAMTPIRFSNTGLSPTLTADAATVSRRSRNISTSSSCDMDVRQMSFGYADDHGMGNHSSPPRGSHSQSNISAILRNDNFAARNSPPNNSEIDSFDVSVVFNQATSSTSETQTKRVSSPPLAHSTPIQPACKRLKFGSHVKILKTHAVTPIPDYEGMSDDMLKLEIAKIGMRPMARKKAVETLKNIYNDLHPAIDPSTPTIRPVAREPIARKIATKAKTVPKAVAAKTVVDKPAFSSLQKTPEKKSAPFSPLGSPISDTEDLGNKSLNESFDEPLEETMLQEADAMPSNGDLMKEKLVNWLKKAENLELYNHVVTMNSVDIEEFYIRMMRSDDPVCEIPKKTLPTLLDSMGISFSAPIPPGGRKGMSAGNGRMKRK